MKKIISLLFIVLFMFFTDMKTVSKETMYNDVTFEQVLQNSDVIINKPFIVKENYKERFISIIENKISNNFDYAYNNFILTKNNTIGLITYSTIENLIPDITSWCISNILNGVEARSDKERVRVTEVSIRGPCDQFTQNLTLFYSLKNYKYEQINLYKRQC